MMSCMVRKNITKINDDKSFAGCRDEFFVCGPNLLDFSSPQSALIRYPGISYTGMGLNVIF